MYIYKYRGDSSTNILVIICRVSLAISLEDSAKAITTWIVFRPGVAEI